MGNFEKNEQNPHDNLKPKFRQKLLKMNKTHKKSMSSRRIHTLFLLTTGCESHAFSDRYSMYRKSFHECVSLPTC